MKRTFSFVPSRSAGVVLAGTALVAATYGLVRLAYGLFLPGVQADLGLTTAAAGLTSAGASVVFCLGALTGFALAGRHPRPLVVASATSAAVGAAGMALAPSAAVFSTFSVLASAGAGLASPALVTVVRRGARAEAQHRAQAVVNSGTGPGLVVAGLLALVLLPDWRAAWLGVAVATLVVGGLVLVLDRTPTDASGRAPDPGLPPRSWFADHRRLVPAAGLLGASSAAAWNYGRAHLVAAGTDETLSVVAWVVLGLGGTAVVATARVLDDAGPRTGWTVTVLAVGGGTALLGLLPHQPVAALVACALFGWGYTAATGVLIVWTSHLDPDRAAAGTSMLFVVLALGQALGAAALGLVADLASHEVGFVAAAALAVLAVPVAVLGRPCGEDGQASGRWYTSGTPSASSSRASRSLIER